MAKHGSKPVPVYRSRKPEMVIANERNRRIDRAQLLERLAEQELFLGHERNAERLSGDAAEMRDFKPQSERTR